MGACRFLTAGESHGPGLTMIVEGMPAGVPVSEDVLAVDLRRRQGGYGRGGRMLIEQDYAYITAGVTRGLTTGAPIALTIENKDWANWKDKTPPPIHVPRPGHADLSGSLKYQHDDMRLVLERSSARETTARVAVAGVAKALLGELGVRIGSHVVSIGGVQAPVPEGPWETLFAQAEESEVRCPDPEASRKMIARIDEAKVNRDTLGGVVEVVAWGLAPGVGSFVHWDRKLDGKLAWAVMSINAIKGVEIGDGFASAMKPGTRVQDAIRWGEGRPIRASNRAGGTEGGVTNGEPIVVRAAMKPISTTLTPQPSVNVKTGKEEDMEYQRSDICAVPAAAVVVEAMVSIVLADAYLEKFGGDNVAETRANMESFLSTIGWAALV
ncbi:MAG: chorismate synthase [Chloroflexota bacterium]|nr:chorismate synthase [Chloroflexota bacterium]